MNQPLKVLIVDDEASQRSGLAAMVSAWGMTAQMASDGEDALIQLGGFPADVIITDLNMQGLDGFGFLQRLRDSGDMPPAIVLTAYGNIETAVKTVHELGAYWFLEKPIQPATLEVLLRRAGSHAGLRAQNRNLERQLVYKGALGEMVGTSPKMQEIFALLQQAGPSKACVLITGESGTGKELVARAIHENSARSQAPFITINCGAFPETLLESELFGYMKGSFTGANENRQGLFQAAHGGTLFMDEIGNMSLTMQVKLYRVLQEGKVRPIGSTEESDVDVRIIAATNKNFEKEISEGRFREDLYYRLSVIPIQLPPLRERREDIPLLSRHFLETFRKSMEKPVTSISPEAMSRLESYDWPGNVRELENTMERAVALETTGEVTLRVMPDRVAGYSGSSTTVGSEGAAAFPPDGVDFEKEVAETERKYLQAALERTNGVRTQAADLLKISYRSFRHYAKKHNL